MGCGLDAKNQHMPFGLDAIPQPRSPLLFNGGIYFDGKDTYFLVTKDGDTWKATYPLGRDGIVPELSCEVVLPGHNTSGKYGSYIPSEELTHLGRDEIHKALKDLRQQEDITRSRIRFLEKAVSPVPRPQNS